MRAAGVAVLILVFLAFLQAPLLAARVEHDLPQEFGFYAKTAKGFQRILPNIIFDEDGVLYIESNSPPQFALSDIEYFLIYGKRDVTYLTLNPMLFFQQSPLGKLRFVLGREIPIEHYHIQQTKGHGAPPG